MDIYYRPYINYDLDRCAALAADAWPIPSVIADDIHSLMIAYVKLSLLFSDYSEVCCTDDEVVGFLFGRTDKKLLSLKESFELNRLSWGFPSIPSDMSRSECNFTGYPHESCATSRDGCATSSTSTQ